jgi:hypothetical protein
MSSPKGILVCFGFGLLYLHHVKILVMDHMVLWRHQACLWIIDKNYIACMVWRMTNIGALVASIFPFSRAKVSQLE